MEAKIHLRSWRKTKTSKWSVAPFLFSQDTQGQFCKLHKDTLLTLSQTISEGDSFFSGNIYGENGVLMQ